jgi:Xaa-Pro aminopeptidase
VSAGPLVNAPRLAAHREEAGLDAVVGASQANVHYLSGYRCWLEPLMREWMTRPGAGSGQAQRSFAISPRTGPPTLIVGSSFAPDALASWVDDVRVYGSFAWDDALPGHELGGRLGAVHRAQRSPAGQDAVAALAGTLDDLGLADGRIGVELSALEPDTAERLRDSLPRAEVLDCTSLLRLVRMVKSEAELVLLSRSAEVNERAGVETARGAHPGLPVSELLDRFRSLVAADGADVDHCSPALGGTGLSSSTSHVLGADEVLSLDFGCVLAGYYSDAGITLALGELPAPLPARYESLREAIVDVGLGALRPGALASSVHETMASFLAGRGITACFPHGHGLGLELRDYPILVPDTGLRIADGCVDVPADLPLEAGMVLNLEVSVFHPGRAALEVEITTLVTADGARPFVDQHRTTPVMPT